MEYLSDALKGKIKKEISNASHVFFFFDYDGTLAPIMPKPPMAKMRDSTRRLLEDLDKNPKFSVAIITGRKLDEIRSIVGLDQLIYAGNHGLELKGQDFTYTHAKTREFLRIRDQIKPQLEALVPKYPGTFIEDKEIGLTFHHRLMEEARLPEFRKDFFAIVEPWVGRKKISIMEIKKAVEVRPSFLWNKGSAVLWILLKENPDSLPIYIGDDKTDEYAFKALEEWGGVTIRVGNEPVSSARYYLNDIYETERFLTYLTVEETAPVSGS